MPFRTNNFNIMPIVSAGDKADIGGNTGIG